MHFKTIWFLTYLTVSFVYKDKIYEKVLNSRLLFKKMTNFNIE